MGSGASLTLTGIVDSSEVCTVCYKEGNEVFHCDECRSIVCFICCPHQSWKSELLNQNRLDIVTVENIPDEPQQEFKRVRCGCFTHDEKLAVLCCFYHKDKKCKCCDVTSHWKLVIGDKENVVSDRLHDTETERHPGEMTSSTVKKMTYITSPFRKKVYKFSSHKDINVAFETAGKCYGIACFDNGLAVSVLTESDLNDSAWQVQFLQFNGNMKKQITVSQDDSTPLFSSPKYLSSNLSEDTLFVSDSGKHAIIALNVKGEVLFVCSDSNIKNPRGITVDSESNVYVADGHNVVKIEAGGKDSNVILDGRNKTHEVVDVIFEHMNKLFVVIQSNGTVTKFSY